MCSLVHLLRSPVTGRPTDLLLKSRKLYTSLIKVGLLLVLLGFTGLKSLYDSVAALDCCRILGEVL